MNDGGFLSERELMELAVLLFPYYDYLALRHPLQRQQHHQHLSFLISVVALTSSTVQLIQFSEVQCQNNQIKVNYGRDIIDWKKKL